MTAQIRAYAHSVIDIFQVRFEPVKIKRRRNMPAVRANAMRFTLRNRILSRNARELLKNLEGRHPGVKSAVLVAVFFFIV